MTRQDSGTTGTLNETQAAASTPWAERGLALALLLWGFLFSLGCTPSSLGDDDIFALPLEIEEDEDGVFVSRLENPTIWGWTVGDDLNFVDRDPEPDEIRKQVYYSPDSGEAVVVYSDRTVFSDTSSMGYVGIDPDMSSLSFEGVPDRTLKFFELPSVSLPDDHEAVTFELSRRWGQGHITPHPVLETMQMRLADDVIVMPVHVHRFLDLSGEDGFSFPKINERVVRDWFDPGRVVNDGVGARFDVHENRNYAQVRQGELKRAWYLHPDRVFEAAGIQFHLASYEEIPQSFGLEARDDGHGLQNLDESAESRGICSSRPSRIGPFVDAHLEKPGIHIYLGGRIQPRYVDGYDALNGLTCGPSCADVFSGRKFIAIDVRTTRYGKNVVAHELGHFLGVVHTADPLSCGAPLGPFPDPLADNLMYATAGEGTELTDAQAARARQVACEWMRRWDLPASPACDPETAIGTAWSSEEEEESNGLPVDFPIENDPFEDDQPTEWL